MIINRAKLLITCFFILSIHILYAKPEKNTLLKDIDNTIYYYHQVAQNKLSLLINDYDLTLEDQKRILYYKGLLNYYKEEQDSALYYIKQATEYYSKTNNDVMYAKCMLGLAWIADFTAYNDLALKNYFKVTEIIKDSTSLDVGIAYLNIAHHLINTKKPYEKYLIKGYNILDKYGDTPYKLFARYKKYSLETSNNVIPNLIDLALDYNNAGFTNKSANMLRTIAYKYYHMAKLDSAMQFVNKAIIRYREDKFGKSILYRCLQLKGKIFFRSNQLDSAMIYFNHLNALYRENNIPNKQSIPYLYIARIDTATGDFKSAFTHYDKYVYYKKRLNKDIYRREATLEEVSSKISELKFDILKNQAEKNRYLLYWIISISLFIIVSLILSFYFYKKQRKIMLKNQELKNINNNIEEKLLVLQNQKESASSFIKSDNPATNYAFAYNETLRKLQSLFPTLNHSQLMYALMFSQNLSNDMICEIQNVQSSSIRMARLRIRRVLNLDKDCDLQKFFSDAIIKQEPIAESAVI